MLPPSVATLLDARRRADHHSRSLAARLILEAALQPAPVPLSAVLPDVVADVLRAGQIAREPIGEAPTGYLGGHVDADGFHGLTEAVDGPMDVLSAYPLEVMDDARRAGLTAREAVAEATRTAYREDDDGFYVEEEGYYPGQHDRD